MEIIWLACQLNLDHTMRRKSGVWTHIAAFSPIDRRLFSRQKFISGMAFSLHLLGNQSDSGRCHQCEHLWYRYHGGWHVYRQFRRTVSALKEAKCCVELHCEQCIDRTWFIWWSKPGCGMMSPNRGTIMETHRRDQSASFGWEDLIWRAYSAECMVLQKNKKWTRLNNLSAEERKSTYLRIPTDSSSNINHVESVTQ